MAIKLASKGIRVNSVLPGWTRSDMTADIQAWDKFNTNLIARATGDDFSAIAVYLALDHSAFHVGGSLVLDGGYIIY